ncbi:MAG: VCBS repeat-containing protein, partial [Planctomycetes bacterium]|nr:VCBS repeat-containing protein [Planctomycetota bacterium]
MAQLQFEELPRTGGAGAGDYTHALALGDVDGDGDLDLVVGNSGFLGGGQTRLYFNDGAGRFSDETATRLPVDHQITRAVALGDVDGDGDLDLVIGNSPIYGTVTGQNRPYLNDGTGTFSDVTATR